MSIETPSFENLRRQTEEEVTERIEKESVQRNIQGMDKLRRELDQQFEEIEEKEYKTIEDKNEVDKIQQQHDKLSYLTKTYELELKDTKPDKPESTLKPAPKIDKESTQALIAKIDNWREKLDQEYEKIEKKEYKIPEDFEEQKVIEKQHQKLSNLVKELEQELKEEPKIKPKPESPLPSSEEEFKESAELLKTLQEAPRHEEIYEPEEQDDKESQEESLTKDTSKPETIEQKEKDNEIEKIELELKRTAFRHGKDIENMWHPDNVWQHIKDSSNIFNDPEKQKDLMVLRDDIERIAEETDNAFEKHPRAINNAFKFIKGQGKKGFEKLGTMSKKGLEVMGKAGKKGIESLGKVFGILGSGILLILILFMLIELKAVEKLVDAGGKTKI
ncbi:MAG: hypothetical protein PHG13_01275 [Candidatus Pacebacteria bacterium]|nr:hypothetical protein [Candidatus Paceibacterota bacterium]MDD5721913.1 hypothetical protein [Candidatus Paceibacterota bacterium]